MIKKTVLLLGIFFIPSLFASKLESLDIKGNKSSFQIELIADASFGYNYHWLESDKKFILDTYNLDDVQNVIKKISHPNIKNIIAVENGSKTRIIVELYKSYNIKVKELNNFLIFDFHLNESSKAENNNSIKSSNEKDNIIIVIDPGHGGKDPGTSGKIKDKTYLEKDIVLELSKKIKKELSRSIKNVEVYLTREDDVFLDLNERLVLANKKKADLFISVHCNSYKSAKTPKGLMIFNLSLEESSEMAKILTELENKDLLDGKHLDDSIDRAVLDISMKANMSMSNKISKIILEEADRQKIDVFSNEVERGKFVVLKSPDTVSILLETGFVSNEEDLSNLTNKRYQESLAKTIANGVKNFFINHSEELGTPALN